MVDIRDTFTVQTLLFTAWRIVSVDGNIYIKFFPGHENKNCFRGKTKSVLGVTFFLDNRTEKSRTSRDASAIFFMYLRNHN